MHRRFILVLRFVLLIVIVSGLAYQPQSSVLAAANLVVSPLTWNIIGLDSNSPTDGPYRFPVGVRACNPASNSVTMTDVEADFVWLAGGTTNDDSIIRLRSGSLDPIAPTPQLDLVPGDCYDFYFEVEVNRSAPSPYDQTRRYRIDINYDDPEIAGLQTVSSTTPRELFVEHLISQSRNAITDVLLDGGSVPAGGSMNLLVGNTYTITLRGGTATQGYNQFEAFINFPNTIFQILSVSTDYSANNSPYVSTNDHDRLYADACRWENDLNSPNYRSCIGGDYKSGGSDVETTYVIKIIGGGGTTQTLNTLLYDFSGSSYHYNADYSLGARFANIIDPTNVTISKSFSPNPTNVNGVTALTITLTNPNAGAISGYNFTDPLPSNLVVATPPNATTTSCGTPTFSPTAGASSISFSNGTIAGNGSCTIKVNVTASTTGSFLNTTDHLFVDLLDTGKFATSTLTVNTTPPLPALPSSCTLPVELARWTMDPSQGTGVPPAESYVAPDVDAAQTAASFISATGIASTISATGSPTANSWVGTTATGWSETPASMNNYFQFVVDTNNYGGVYVVFDVGLFDNGDWANPTSNIYVNTSANGGAFTSYQVTPGTYLQADKGAWSSGLRATAASTGSDYTTFRFGADGASKAAAEFRLDDVIFYGCERLDPPAIAKAFSPNPIAEGGTSTLTFTLTNLNADALTGVAFSDTLPAGVTLASTPTTTCGGTVTGTVGGSTIDLSGGNLTGTFANLAGTIAVTNGSTTVTGTGTSFLSQLAVGRRLVINSVMYTISAIASNTSLTLSSAYIGTTASGLTVPGELTGLGTCTVTATVTSSSAGAYQNVSGFVSSSNGGTNTGATGSASASLTVIEAPQIDKLFSPNPVLAGGTSTLMFNVINLNQNDSLTGVTFTDTFPTTPGAMTVASPLTATLNGCGAGTLLDNTGGGLAAGDSGIRLNGATITAGGTCTVKVDVTVPSAPTSGNYANTTTAVSSTNGGTGNTAADTLTIEPSDPSISLYKQVGPNSTGPWSKFLGVTLPEDVYYLFTIENTGNVPLSPVSVNDPTVDVSGCTWPASLSVASAANDNHIATCVVGPVTAVNGSTTNTAAASGMYGGTPYTSTSSSATYAGQALTLVKSVTQTSFNLAGETLNYSYLVTNSGFTPLLGPVTVSDDKTTVTCPAVSSVGDGDDWLDPADYPTPGISAESITCTATYSVQTADAAAGFVTNTASASVGSITSNTDSETVNQLRPDLTVTKTNNSGGGTVGTDFIWTLEVANSGTADAVFANGQTILSDPLPAGASYNPVILVGGAIFMGPVDCGISGGILTCTANGGTVTIPAGDSFTAQLTVTPTAAGSLANTATVDPNGNSTEGNETNNTGSDTVDVTAVVDLSLDKQVSNATPNVGSTVTFTLVVTNAGPSTATNIVVTDVVPNGYTYVGSSIAGGTSRNDSNPAGTGLTWTINSLASSASTSLTYQATVLGTGTYDNYAEITSHTETDSDSTPGDGSTTQDDDDTEAVSPIVITPADLTVTKTNNTANGWVASGDIFQWTITVRNGLTAGTASFASGDVILSDSLPTGQSYGAVTVTNGAPPPTGTIDCSITGTTLSCVANGAVTLPADASFGVAFNVTTSGTANLSNTATVDPNNEVPESNEGNNTGSNTVTVFDSAPSKTIVATSESTTAFGSDGFVRAAIGEIVRYRLSMVVPEGGPFTNVQLLDNIPTGFQFLNDGTARVAFVSSTGGSVTSAVSGSIPAITTALTNCSGLNIVGNSTAVVPTCPLPDLNVSRLAASNDDVYGTGTDFYFKFGNMSNTDNDADNEYIVVEFNALALNVNSGVTINQAFDNVTGTAGANSYRDNNAIQRVNGSNLGSNSADARVIIAEPAITNVAKSVSSGPYNPGSAITYTLTFSNVASGDNAATAFDVVLTDTLDANLTPGTISVSSTQTDPCIGGTAFTADDGSSGQNVAISISCLDPGESVTVTINATINAGAAGSTNISNTGSLTYSSLPGTRGNCATAPFTCTAVGGSGSGTGERNGSSGAGTDSSVLNNYSDSGAVSFTVAVADLLPIADPDTNMAAENGPAVNGNVLTNETSLGDEPTTVTAAVDDDGDALVLGTAFSTDAGGTLTINADGTYTYTPPATLPEGTVLTEVFTYTITDVDGDSDTATLTITVDRLPQANSDTNTATEGGANITGNVISNDDEGNINANVTSANQGGTAITVGTAFTTSAGGTLTLNADGSYTYTPPATLPEGGPLTEVFNYTITDNDGDTSSSTLTITVDRLPNAVPDTNTATEGGANATGNVITNDDQGNTSATVTAADQGGTTITIGSAFTTAAGGSLTLNANGTYTYTPPSVNLVPPGGLTEVFNYTITDNDGDTSSATLTITVGDSDRVPDAVADTNSATEGGANATGNVLTNENSLGDTPTTVTAVVDDDGDPLTLGIAFATDGGGSLTINADGTYAYTPPAINLVPPAGLVEVFTYTITDLDGDTDTTTLTITVSDSDRLPIATNNSYTINEGATASGNVMTDGTADTLGDPPTTVTSYDAVSMNGGTVTVAADGTFTYDPNGYVGTDTFTYTITDVDGDTSTATVTITVNQSLIGISKRVVSTTEVSSGTYDVTYELHIENFGTTALNNVQVTEDLSATFPAPTTFTVQSVNSAAFAENGSYNGSSNTNLLSGSDSLAVGASGNITLVVRVVPASGGPFQNTAIASGQCPTCPSPVTDDSQDGSDPDPDNDGDPTNDNDPTPLTYGPNLFDPPFGLKVVDASGLPVLRWTMVWINDSNIVAINAQVSDPISAGTSYAGGLTCTASGVTTTTSCVYEAPSGAYPRGRVIWSGNLGPDLGATDAASAANEIAITFNVNVNSGITSVQNNATIDSDLNGDNDITDPGEQVVASASSSWGTPAAPTGSGSNRTQLPATGFAPNVVTDLSNVPSEMYTAAGDLTVEIPSLKVKIPVVGVPKKDGTWNVSWLGDQAGWLEGSAFPSWSGNSVLTGHVYLSNGLPGPFVDLNTLKYGDQIIIHAYGQKYTFEVRENKVVEPNDQTVMKHEDKSWLTLVTCKEYDAATNTYRKRVVVRAVLVSVAWE